MLTRTFLIRLSRSEGFKNFLTRFSSFNRVTRRFVAGETIPEGIEAVRLLNRKSIAASFDHLGEAIKSADETRSEVKEYVRLFDAIHESGLNSNVSVKLSQLGLDIDRDLCCENLQAILETARRHSNFVRIDMEESSKVDRTLDIYRRVRSSFDNVGVVIQAYLYRSEGDVTELLKLGTRIRLCKGAYDEPASAAFPDKADVDRNYIRLMERLLSSGIYHGIATHDENIISATRRFASENGIAPDSFEFQMLYGVRRDLQEKLAGEGFRMRVYVPYGRFWYPYFMRRIAERPANAWFVLKNMMRG